MINKRLKILFNKQLNIAEWITMTRIFAAPFLLLLIFLEERSIFSWLLLLSLSTDVLDGYIARKLKIVSDRGAQMDSVADAITFAVAMIGIIKFEAAFIKAEYMLVLLAFVPYFFQLIISYWRYGMPTSFHTYLAKVAAIAQGAFLLTLFFFGVSYIFFYFVIVISVIETIEEIVLIFLHRKWRANVKGLYWVILKGLKKHI